MPEVPSTSKQEIKLFYCYAREDKALRDELQVNLAGLRRQYRLINWYDREILPGEQWEESIDRHLSTADVILLLISPHFVDSDYCYGKEMQRALERHQAGSCRVIPILLRPTYWEDTPLGAIQMLPTDARPITSWSDRYEAFHDVAKGIGTAIKALLMLTSQPGKSKEEWMHEGNVFIGLKRYDEALIAFEQAIRLDPNDIHIYYNKGLPLSELNRHEEALVAFEQAIRLDPDATTPYYGKGASLHDLNRHEEAIVAFEQIIHIDPHSPVAYYNIGRILYNLKRYEEALLSYEQAIHLDTNFAVAYNDKGLSLRALHREKEAQLACGDSKWLAVASPKQP